jgi:hypothetical protein
MTETTFTLIRTIKSRGGGDDDYDVCDGDKVIGRIVRHPQAPMEAPWFWAITTEGLSRSWLTDRGYAVSREHALAQFRARWILNDLVCLRSHRWPRLSLVAFSATPKFGSPWTAQATSGGFVADAPRVFREAHYDLPPLARGQPSTLGP